MKMEIASLKNLKVNCFNQQLTPSKRWFYKLQYIVDPVALVPYVCPGKKKELAYELKKAGLSVPEGILTKEELVEALKVLKK